MSALCSSPKLVILGAPGAGKGTQAALLAEKLNTPHLSTGDILREEVRKGTELGKRAQEYMDRGDLVPDDIIIGAMNERLKEAGGSTSNGFILDGFPRTLEQAKALSSAVQLDLVFLVKLSQDEVVRRLSARRVCERCGRNYNLLFNPPQEEGRCDLCGAALASRVDDSPEVIRRRYQLHRKQSKGVEDFYREQGILQEIEGDQPIAEIHQAILDTLND